MPVAASQATRDATERQQRPGPFGGKGFGVGAVVGYGATLDTPGRVELEPLAWLFGLRFNYDFASGLMLGGYLDYALGDPQTQTYRSMADADVKLRTKAGLTNAGLSLGYDERLGPLVLRYLLELGVTHLRWEFAGAPDEGLGPYDAASGRKAGLHVAPGLGLFWPIDRAYVGLEYRYLIQLSEIIPSGVTGLAHGGIRW